MDEYEAQGRTGEKPPHLNQKGRGDRLADNGPKMVAPGRKVSLADVLEKIRKAATEAADSTGDFKVDDVQEHRPFAVLAYCCFLVFIPMFACKGSKFAKFHARQGLTLLAATVLALLGRSIAVELVEMLQWAESIMGALSILVSIPFFVVLLGIAGLSILGAVYAIRGQAKALPYIGGIDLLGGGEESQGNSI